MRFDTGKLRLDLIPPEVLIELSRVYSKGAIKYDDNNWRKGMKWSRCIGSALRHFFKWTMGERYDQETGCHHLMMAAWNCGTLFVYDLQGLGEDDRCLPEKQTINDDMEWVDINKEVS